MYFYFPCICCAATITITGGHLGLQSSQIGFILLDLRLQYSIGALTFL
jgi:hypothetical protein